MKTSTAVCLLVLFSVQAFGQSYSHRFDELFGKNDIAAQEKLLEEWEKDVNKTDDPEFYTSYFNYCVKNSKKESIWTSDNPAGKSSLKVTEKTETGEDVMVYMNFETVYDKNMLNKGFETIAEGIKKYPARLDMRFGEIYMYGETADYEKFTSKIIETVEYSDTIKNKWLWTNNLPVENPEKFMLDAVQDYQVTLYSSGNDNLLDNMELIAESVLKFYPEHVESLSNLSLVYSIKKQYDKAFAVLSKAEEIAPRDCIILNNIAQLYKLTGDTENSLKYYKLITKYGDPKQKELAETQINGTNARQR
ncbi:MAG: tetratricopeptide repeat protein [Endomicrobium sp.]|jgi:tetratricopeptide (TPR) repeat protein|nr:tetratricopeptide repeat protein [Endomicrobium sp.]